MNFRYALSKINAGILSLGLLLSLVMTYPLVLHPGSIILGPPGDNFEYLYKMWWFKEALLVKGISPFFNPGVFAPFGYPLALSETTLANMLTGFPLTILFGEVISYNAVMVASFVLSLFAGYLLGYSISSRRAAGLVTGIVFAFAPYRLAHLGAGHLPLMGTQWIPLTFFYLERMMRRQRLRDAAMGGLFLGLTGLSSWYYAYMMGIFVPVYVVLRGLRSKCPGSTRGVPSPLPPPHISGLAQRFAASPLRGRLWRKRTFAVQWGIGLAWLFVVAGIVLLPALVPLLRTTGRQAIPYPLRYVDQWSASPLDFVVPNIMHPLWGAVVAGLYPQNVFENVLFVGWIPLALAWVGWRQRNVAARAFGWLAVGAFVLALGTTLHVGRHPVQIPVPSEVQFAFERGMSWLSTKLALNPVSRWDMGGSGTIVVPMPTLLLYLFMPFFSAMRVWTRFGLFVLLGVAVLSGVGAAYLADRWRNGLVVALLCAGIIVEFAPMPYALGYARVQPQPVDTWLAKQPGQGLVIQFPLDRTWAGYPLYEARWHGKPVAYGYGTFVPHKYQEAAAPLETFPSRSALALLRNWGVRYIVIAQDSLAQSNPDAVETLNRVPGIQLIWAGTDRNIYAGDRLLRLLPVSPLVPPSEFLYGDKQSFLQDNLSVYEIK